MVKYNTCSILDKDLEILVVTDMTNQTLSLTDGSHIRCIKDISKKISSFNGEVYFIVNNSQS